MTTLTTGQRAEDFAKRWLIAQQAGILETNYHSRWGEIDIIATDQDTICFIEVRYRKTSYYGTAAESVTAVKQKRIIQTAHRYLTQNQKHRNRPARFDIISMSGSLNNPDIDWYKDAFMIHAD